MFPFARNALLTALLSGLFILPGQGLRADAIVQSNAMFSTTIAEIFIDEQTIIVDLEVGLNDLPAFTNLLPDELYERLGNEPLPPMTFHPIFIELIKNSDKYTLDYEETEKGVTVRYTADDSRIVMLVQEHAKLVSRFLKNGMSEIHKPYELPKLESPTETVATPQVRAIAAKDALFKKLSGRLMEVMKSQGPVAAIEVCSREASGIAESISESHGVKIGRTALKLRNPNNQPPYWVAPLMSEEATEPTFVDLPGGHTGALLPIRLQSKCLTCHGGDEIPDAVQSKLAEFYPDDKATGFKEGDLRGWFWVDVPDDKQRQSKLEDVQ